MQCLIEWIARGPEAPVGQIMKPIKQEWQKHPDLRSLTSFCCEWVNTISANWERMPESKGVGVMSCTELGKCKVITGKAQGKGQVGRL